MRTGVTLLHHWGLLDRIIDAGTPAVRWTTFIYGDEQVGVEIKPSDGISALYAPRRTVLDLSPGKIGGRARLALTLLCKGDLEEALEAGGPAQAGEEWRVHFHVPLYFEGSDGIESTARELTTEFFRLVNEMEIPHLEIETYTFDVLPAAIRSAGVVKSVSREYAWVLRAMR